MVRLAKSRVNDQLVALKTYEKYKLLEKHVRKNLIREIKILEQLKHKNIIKLYDALENKKQINMVMEFIGKKSLLKVIKRLKNKRFSEKTASKIFKQIVEGVKYCHS